MITFDDPLMITPISATSPTLLAGNIAGPILTLVDPVLGTAGGGTQLDPARSLWGAIASPRTAAG